MAAPELNRQEASGREVEASPERSAEKSESSSLEQEIAAVSQAAESETSGFSSGSERVSERLADAGPEAGAALKGFTEEADQLLAELRQRTATIAGNETLRPDAPTLSPRELDTMSPSELNPPHRYDKTAPTLVPGGPTLSPSEMAPTMVPDAVVAAPPTESSDRPTLRSTELPDLGDIEAPDSPTIAADAPTMMPDSGMAPIESSESYADTVAVDANVEAQALSERFMKQHELPKNGGDIARLSAEMGISTDEPTTNRLSENRDAWTPENSPEEMATAGERLTDEEIDARKDQAEAIRTLLMGPMKGNAELTEKLHELRAEISAAQNRFAGQEKQPLGSAPTMRVESPSTNIEKPANVTVVESKPDETE